MNSKITCDHILDSGAPLQAPKNGPGGTEKCVAGTKIALVYPRHCHGHRWCTENMFRRCEDHETLCRSMVCQYYAATADVHAIPFKAAP